jgi:hypothetical protein
MNPVTTAPSMEERLREEVTRRTDEVELLRELLAEATGLTQDGVMALMRLHRRARGVNGLDFSADDLLGVLGRRFWPTGVIARSLLPNGGRGFTARQRSDHHHRVSGMLKQLEGEGLAESRHVTVSNRMEWRRL